MGLWLGGFSMKKLVGLLVMLVGACTAPARIDQMVGQFSTPALAETDARYQSVRIARADVDPKAHPVWYTSISNESLSGAVRATLDGRGLFALYPGNAKMEMDVQLVDFRRPPAKLDEATTVSIRYVVRDVSTGGKVFDQTITTVGTAPFEKNVPSDQRTRAAAEQAMAENMAQFINKFMAATGQPQAQPQAPQPKKPKAKQQ